MTGVIGLRRSVVFSVDVCVCCAAFNTRALRNTDTMACDNCQWTMLDFSVICGLRMTGVIGLCRSVVANTSNVSYAL